MSNEIRRGLRSEYRCEVKEPCFAMRQSLLRPPGRSDIYWLVVRMEGVEPTRLAALDPKSSASASFATSAYFTISKGSAKVAISLQPLAILSVNS